MDGTQPSSNQGAVRKRRSSILKSQRAPRTPFSELEFNVATPTDATKSRRVSFSRRTGVAEFVKNEATTTWKNVYEEQNKSLESSGHDSDLQRRPSVLGNRLFENQFQEVEIDFGFAPANPMALQTSMNSANITQQIAMLDAEAPQNKFELSALTESNTKIMGDLTNPTLGGDTGRLDVNFSAVNDVGANQGDDLDDIVRDLETSRPKVVGPGPFAGEVSQYIEFDLNTTQGHLRGNESDMSITDTITSPKKEVSKSISLNLNKWTDDKENMVLNPYVTPAETDNFAINDESSKVLVFDGKKLQYADVNADLDELVEDLDKDAGGSKTEVKKRQTIVFDSENGDVSVTQCVPNMTVAKGSKTIVFEDDIADMSVTQAIPNKILNRTNGETSSKRQTIVFNEDADISITQAIPNEIFESKPSQKRQTIVYTNDDADISMTQCIPNVVLSKSNIENIPANENEKPNGKRRTIVFANDDGDISMTQALPNNILSALNQVPAKHQTIVFENLDAEISMTQAIPNNILSCVEQKQPSVEPKRQTIVFDNGADISTTQAVPNNILSSLKPQVEPKRQTIVFDSNDVEADISMTETLSNKILGRKSLKPETEPMAESNIINEDFYMDISMTQALPSNILSRKSINLNNTEPLIENKRNTILSNEEVENALEALAPVNESNRKSVICDANSINMTSHVFEKTLDATNGKSTNPNMTQDVTEKTLDASNRKSVSPNSDTQSEVKSTENEGDKSLHISPEVAASVEAKRKAMETTLSNLQKLNATYQKDLDLTLNQTLQRSFKPETLVYMSLTETVKEDGNPTSKGDEFHASSQKIEQENEQIGLENPQTTSHSHKAPKVNTKRKPEQVESKFEEAIISISYDKMAASSTKIEGIDQEEDKDEPEISKIDSKVSQLSKESSKDIATRKSVLNELLDMSFASVSEDLEDKNVVAIENVSPIQTPQSDVSSQNSPIEKPLSRVNSEDLKSQNSPMEKPLSRVNSEDLGNKVSEKNSVASDGSMFLIIRDSKDYIQPQLGERNRTTDTKDLVQEESHNSLDKFENNLQSKISLLLHQTESRKSMKEFEDKSIHALMDETRRKTFKEADDTKELLEILSNLTDKTVCNDKSPRKSIPYSKSESSKRLTFAPEIELKNETEELAQALKERSELEEEYVPETPAQLPKKGMRLSHEVVKTLQFDEDTTEVTKTPLKKTAFGETSYMSDKSRVIPSFLNSEDGIKELMDDLVKPMADAVPVTAMDKNPSTCSTQIQVNLHSSSQIDVELTSNTSTYEVLKNMASDIANEANKSVTAALKNYIQPLSLPVSEKSSVMETETYITQSEKVILFDHNNPLNNVLLAPINFSEAHPYNPESKEYNVERVSIKYDYERVDPLPNIQEEISVCQSEKSLKVTEVIDTEVNTLIAMKPNKTLLDESSSLTLVDDDMEVDEPSLKSSPIKVIYQLNEIILDDESRKRMYSPNKSANSVTPKPLSKMQRISNSPVLMKSPDKRKSKSPDKTKSPEKVSPIKGGKLSPTRRQLSPTKNTKEYKPNTVVTVQRMTAEYVKQEKMETSSFTSSKNQDQTHSEQSGDSTSTPSTVKTCSMSSWRSEGSEPERRPVEDPGANVIARIDMLPCMGTHLCEWEPSTGDWLAFRLARGRVRLALRLRHCVGNAARRLVRADTPVDASEVGVNVHETCPTEIKKVIATLSVKYAAEAARAHVARVKRAGDIPDALRRCAAVADNALRWARCMYEAYMQLAYTLTMAGRLTLKVCNLPLRSVWEVTLQIAMSSHPVASRAAAAAVVGAPPGDVAGIPDGLPSDWGHVPRTVWKIFKYLKHKKADALI